MKTLESQVTPERAEVVIGEAIKLKVELSNGGSSPASIPNRMGPSEFEFIFRASNQGKVVTLVSEPLAAAQQSTESLSFAVPARDLLSPAEKAVYLLDPTPFLSAVLAPGTYYLSVAFGTEKDRWESVSAPIRVVAPRPSDFSTFVQSEAEQLALTYVNVSGPQKQSAVLSYFGRPNSSGQGVYHRLAEATLPEVINGVAIAREFEPTMGERWTAWLQGGKLASCIVQISSIRQRAQSEALGLRSAQLHSVGWRTNTDAAVFAVLGLDSQARLSLALVRIEKDQPVSTTLVTLSGTSLPVFWRLAYREGANGPSLIFVYSETSSRGARLYKQEISLGSSVASAPSTLLELDSALLGFSLDSSPGGLDVVDVLRSPLEGKVAYTLIRVPLVGAAEPLEWEFTPPDLPSGRQLQKWTLPSQCWPEPVIVVKAGDRLMSNRVTTQSGWVKLADQSTGADFLRLETVQGHAWAFWSDPVLGVRMDFIR